MKRCNPFEGMACSANCDCAREECCKVRQYQKKPVVVEAIRFTRDDFDAVVAFTGGKVHDLNIERRPDGACFCVVSALEGEMKATEGDYIIKGVKGEFYPCKPDIFERTYDLYGGAL